MKLVERKEVKKKSLPGRILQLVTGQEDAVSHSDMITMGFARYSAESGPMDPHHHVEEVVYGGFGDEPDELGDSVSLEPGMTLHFPDKEWHVFEFAEGGHIDIIFFYANPDVYSTK